MTSARDLLSALALELGFEVTGWTDAAPRTGEVDAYRAWLDGGRHGSLEYLPRQLPRRADLSSSLEGAGSVLVLGVSHAFAPQEVPPGGVRLGRVARYAWTPDYHAQLEPLLDVLRAEALTLGVRARGYVDHGPVLERALAGRAFPGWQGRSGMLLSTSLGAFTTLAVLLTDLSAPPPAPAHPDRCGRCTRCVTACPTDAIGPDRLVDARVCLSALTIEQRGPVPWALRPRLGEWLFGCDVCSEVCPWTVRAGPLAQLFVPDAELAHPDLTRFFGVSEREFQRQYGHTAFSRPRRKGMARNAAYVAGNHPDLTGRAVMDLAAQDPAWEVREAAAWAYGRHGLISGLEHLRHDPHEDVARAAVRALEEHG
ncbi:tRNA epoxyqueuosine(34) reductase QueG [Deinococcus aquiradiocola]|uniref:Epoxyqueuosine reductase n=1 Tax=Deinococcus aquiradiocola TaxID=393059 RepID=A0A917UJT5_9DEIO|nr:tRNA epoxyqueuosine(34) reductase QueG [Deinococcus aquiradiocola]GGJ62740.1 epoxyqueuosine reductase [Deinococcus aquiradiocola]